MTLVRRNFLGSLLGLGLGAKECQTAPGCGRVEIGDGLLVPGDGVLALPSGFHARVIQRSGTPMSDGYPVPGAPDGMACFEHDGAYILLRNHELDDGDAAHPRLAFNPHKAGGVTRLVVEKDSLQLRSSHWLLTGTARNCAGGSTPWGWLSCEEAKDAHHGWVFLCRTQNASAAPAERLPSLGRFRHEAAVFLPNVKATFLTEDEPDSALYRHIGGANPFEGELSALRVVGRPGMRLAQEMSPGQSVPVDWVPIAEPFAPRERTAHQAFQLGAAVVSRGEGMWARGSSVFFVSTDGGPLGRGQIFRLDVLGERGTLTLVAQAESEQTFHFPDNITVSPTGAIYFVEDGSAPNRIWRLRADGNAELFGQNLISGGASELAGICFSPDGGTMFLNIQTEGLTVAVTGPFGGVAL